MQTFNNAELAFLALLSYPSLAKKSLRLCANNSILFPKAIWPHLAKMWEAYLLTLTKSKKQGTVAGKDIIAANLSEAVQSDKYMTEEQLEKSDALLQRFLAGDVPTEQEGIEFVQKVAQLDAGRRIMASISSNADLQSLEAVVNKAKQNVDSLADVTSTRGQIVYSPFKEIEKLATYAPRIPTGINWLDEITSGGGREGELWLILGPSGGGKCLDPDTEVLMYNGITKKAKDIRIGDQLMGPDSKPRNVLQLGSGRSTMYKITPVKGNPFIVNKYHILTFVAMPTSVKGQRALFIDGIPYYKDELVDIAIEDYLALSKNKREQLKLIRTGVDFPVIQEPPIDPYFAGLYLGDGTRRVAMLTLSDPILVDYCKEYGKQMGWRVWTEQREQKNCEYVHITSKLESGEPATPLLKKWLLDENRNKIIHPVFKYGSRQTRLQILAGLLDTDGYAHHGHMEISTKFDTLAEDILFVARSLGFAAYDNYGPKTCYNTGAVGMYHRITISGHLNTLPVRCERMKLGPRRQRKNVLHTGLSIEKLPIGDYCGFVIDGDHRFLLGDFTITHNTTLTIQYACAQALMGNSILWATYEQGLEGDLAERIISNVTDESLDKIRDVGFNNLPEGIQRKFWASVAGADDKLTVMDMTKLAFNPTIDSRDNGGMYSVWQQYNKLKAEGRAPKTIIVDWIGAMMSVVSATTGKAIDNAMAFQIATQAEVDVARKMVKQEPVQVIFFHQTDTKSQSARPIYIPDKTCALNMKTLCNFMDVVITLSNRDIHDILWMSAVKSRKAHTISKTVKLLGDRCRFVNAPFWAPNTDGNFYNQKDDTLSGDTAPNEVTSFSREIE